MKDERRSMWHFRLYTAGATPRSTRAVRNMVEFCRKNLPERHRIRVVDLYKEPSEAAQAQVVAAPTLLKLRPAPVRRVIGDMSDEAGLKRILGIAAEADA